MRDIRGDLQDRASFLEEQINAAQSQFEKRLEQLNLEHQAKMQDLQFELEAVTTLIEREYQRLTNAPAQDERPRPAPAAEGRQAPEPYRRPRAAELESEHRHHPEQEPYSQPAQAQVPAQTEAEPPRRPARKAEPYHRSAAETEYRRRPEQEPYSQPAQAQAPAQTEAEPPRRPMREAEPYHLSAAEAEYGSRPQQEPYRQLAQAQVQAQAEAEPPRRPAREAEPYRRPHAAEAELQQRPAPDPLHQEDREPRPVPPQVYRRAPLTREGEREQQRPAERVAQAPQQPPLADFLIRKLSEMGAMTLDELCQVAVQGGYCNDGEIADRGVQVTLMNIVKAGFIRQQPNGTFAPATVMDTIRLRRAI